MVDYPDFTKDVYLRQGTPYADVDTDTIAVVGYRDMLSVSGRGKLVSAYLRLYGSPTSNADKIRLTIDGVEVFDNSPQNLNGFGIYEPYVQPIYIVSYDNFSFIYVLGVTPGYTFDNSLYFEWYASAAVLRSVGWIILYTLF